MVMTKQCKICGATFEITYATKRRMYCSPKCSEEANRMHSIERGYEYRLKQKIDKRSESIKHQQDPTIWTRDYAEKQKQKTLAMMGRIEV